MKLSLVLIPILAASCSIAVHAQGTFSLVNAVTDTIIGPLNDGDTIYLDGPSGVGRDLNIMYENPSLPEMQSVKFDLDSPQQLRNCESAEPFALAGDRRGDFNSWTPTEGAHTLKAIAYSRRKCSRQDKLAVETIMFNVTDRPELPPQPDEPNYLDVAVYLPKVLKTCFMGAPCYSDSAECVGKLRNSSDQMVHAFTPFTFRVEKNTDSLQPGEEAVCLELELSDDERIETYSEFDLMAQSVSNWTNGDIVLNFHYLEFDYVEAGMSRISDTAWVAPWDFEDIALTKLDFLPDFNLIVHGIQDRTTSPNLHYTIRYCGLAYGANYGIAGGGWSEIPKTNRVHWFECAEENVLTHEWLHQVHYAYQQMSGFVDLYGTNFPPCGEADPDPKKWFPDSHECRDDPDYEYCGQSRCGSSMDVNEHILREHWDPEVDFVANYCKNGVTDNIGRHYETGPDTGGSCDLSSTTTHTQETPEVYDIPSSPYPIPDLDD